MNKVLVIAPHPDDETLGCAGALLKHLDTNDEVYWVIATSITEFDGWEPNLVKLKESEIEKALKAYHFTKNFRLNFPASKLDTVPLADIVKSISTVLNEVKPNIIYIPNRSDVHSDHRRVFDASISATKCFRNSFIKKILMYECLSETEISPPFTENAFCPNYFVDISKFLHEKLEIIEIYKSEFKAHPFPRSAESVKSLALLRGAAANVTYAEAFFLIREIA